MPDSVLVDTNVLVYAVDRGSGPKSATASLVLQEIVRHRRGNTTPQVVNEFIASATAFKPRQILTTAQAVAWIARWINMSAWRDLTAATSRLTLRAIFQYQMGVYDAQMWAAARGYAIPILLTEDLQSQPEIEGVRYINPFDKSFELADLGL